MKEIFKKGLFVTSEVCGRVTKISSVVSMIAFFTGLAACTLLDIKEKREINKLYNKNKTK